MQSLTSIDLWAVPINLKFTVIVVLEAAEGPPEHECGECEAANAEGSRTDQELADSVEQGKDHRHADQP